MVDKKTIEEGIIRIKANIGCMIKKTDLPYIVDDWYRNFHYWEEEKFEKVIRNFIDNTTEETNFPKVFILKAIYYNNFQSPKTFRHCSKCKNSGYRRYRVMVKRGGSDFETRRIIDKVQTCVAACGCEHGKEKHEKEGIPWYNDVKTRKGVTLLTEEEEKNFRPTQIIEGLEPQYEEELPF